MSDHDCFRQRCNLCDLSFTDSNVLNSHLQEVHYRKNNLFVDCGGGISQSSGFRSKSPKVPVRGISNKESPRRQTKELPRGAKVPVPKNSFQGSPRRLSKDLPGTKISVQKVSCKETLDHLTRELPEKVAPRNTPSRKTGHVKSDKPVYRKTGVAGQVYLGSVLKTLKAYGAQCGVAMNESCRLRCIKCGHISVTSNEACFHFTGCKEIVKKSRLIAEKRVRWLCLKCKSSFSIHDHLCKHLSRSYGMGRNTVTKDQKSILIGVSSTKGKTSVMTKTPCNKDKTPILVHDGNKYWCTRCGTSFISHFSVKGHTCEKKIAYMASCKVSLKRFSAQEIQKYRKKSSESHNIRSILKKSPNINQNYQLSVKQEADCESQNNTPESPAIMRIKTEALPGPPIAHCVPPPSKPSPYGCQCNEAFTNMKEYEFHIERKHGFNISPKHRPVQCMNCKLVFTNQLSQQLHTCGAKAGENLEERGNNVGVVAPTMAPSSSTFVVEPMSNDHVVGSYSSEPSYSINPNAYYTRSLTDEIQQSIDKFGTGPSGVCTTTSVGNRNNFVMTNISLHDGHDSLVHKNANFANLPVPQNTQIVNPLLHGAVAAETLKRSGENFSVHESQLCHLDFSSAEAYRDKTGTPPCADYYCSRWTNSLCDSVNSPFPPYLNKLASNQVEETSDDITASCDATKDFSALPDKNASLETGGSSSFVLSVAEMLENNDNSTKCVAPAEKLQLTYASLFSDSDAYVVKSDSDLDPSSSVQGYICPECYKLYTSENDFATHCAIEHNLHMEGTVKVGIVLKDSAEKNSS